MNIQSQLPVGALRDAQGLINQLVDTWNAKDEKAYSMLFTVDAEYTSVIDETYYGREMIADKHVFPFTTINKKAQLDLSKALLRAIGGSHIFMTAYWTVTGSVDFQGRFIAPRHGIINAIIEQAESELLFSHLHNCDVGFGPFSPA